MAVRVLWISERAEDIVNLEQISVTKVSNAIEGLHALRNDNFDVVLASFPLSEWSSPASLLEECQRIQLLTPVVIHAPAATATEVVHLIRSGAFHVLRSEDATSVLYMAARMKGNQATLTAADEDAPLEPWFRPLVGNALAMRRIVQTIRLVAPRRSTVLITGETGTGKEVVARSIHKASDRCHLQMVCVNCSALPETLLEAELFGHVKGAFTGATNHRIGRFEQANHSTLFLDEIGDLPLSLQAKLLRVLQEREFQRLGSSESVRVDVRIIAATHTDLLEMIRQGKFREDLYYRLNVVPIVLPPLRERGADIQMLVRHFVEKICHDEAIPMKQISTETVNRLAEHDWPGNVRQLENAIEKAIVMSGERTTLFPGDFPLPPRQYPICVHAGLFIALPDQGLDFERTVGSIELNILEQALKKTRGNKKLAAEMLGLKRTTLSAKLKSLAAASAA